MWKSWSERIEEEEGPHNFVIVGIKLTVRYVELTKPIVARVRISPVETILENLFLSRKPTTVIKARAQVRNPFALKAKQVPFLMEP